VKRELRKFGPNAEMGETVAAWPAAVGDDIARNAWPARFQRDGTLIVHVSDAVWGFELTHQADEIRSRLPGTPPLKFIPGPLPEPSIETTSAAPDPLPEATLEQARTAADWASAIEDEELRETVAKAARASLVRASNDRSF
jgi:Dna[CI] antecedent DciA-like protein